MVGLVPAPLKVAVARIFVPLATAVGLIEKGTKSSPDCDVVLRLIAGATKSRFHVEPPSYDTPIPNCTEFEPEAFVAAE